MTHNDPYKQAATAYQGSNESAMNNFEIVVELYKGMIKQIRQAKAAYESGKLEEMVQKVEQVNKVLIALQSHIDKENGGEAAEFLNEFYNGVFASLSRVQRKDDPAAEFDAILEHIQPVYEIWCRHAHGASGEQNKDDNGSGVITGA